MYTVTLFFGAGLFILFLSRRCVILRRSTLSIYVRDCVNAVHGEPCCALLLFVLFALLSVTVAHPTPYAWPVVHALP